MRGPLFALAAAAALIASPGATRPLTIAMGESWAFSVHKGEPVRARRIAPGAKLKAGEIKASVSAMAGTTMTLTNNSRTSYTFIAELVGAAPSKSGKRMCTLPPMRPTIEYWPVKSNGVRIGSFKATTDAGACP